jgi:hypothetical protein
MEFFLVLRIRIRMFLGLPDPDPDSLVRGMDPDLRLKMMYLWVSYKKNI